MSESGNEGAARGNAAVDETEATRDELPLCLNCLAPQEHAGYCLKCGVPVGSFAATDPMLQIHTQGSAWRNAKNKTVSGFVLVGMWLVFLPAVLVMCSTAFWELPNLFGHGIIRVSTLVAMFFGLAITLLYVAMLWNVTRNYVRRRRSRRGACETCGYDLRGLSEPRCPECGMAFDPELLSNIAP